MIYALALHEPGGLQVQAKPGGKLAVNPQHSQSSPMNGLLRTCKEIRSECEQMFYTVNDHITVLLPFIKTLDPDKYRTKYANLVAFLERLPIDTLLATRFVFILLKREYRWIVGQWSKIYNRGKLMIFAGTLSDSHYDAEAPISGEFETSG